jgi:hypothetical protein
MTSAISFSSAASILRRLPFLGVEPQIQFTTGVEIHASSAS